MRTKIALMSSLAALGALLPSAAFAEEAAAADAPVAAPAAPPAPAEAAPAPAAEAAPAPAPAATEAVAAQAAAPAAMPGWMRIDSDWGGLQLWGGATYPLADGFGLAFDMYVTTTLGELDLGPAITAGPVTITPMIGLQVDWAKHRAAALVPQLYVVGGVGPIYGEFWFQYYMNKTFAPEAAKDLTSNNIYSRIFVDYKFNDYIGVGPELDLATASEADPSLISLAVGPNVMLSNAGANSTFMVFLGYETKDSFPDDPTAMPPSGPNHLAGRLTFVHNF